jgi:hypothetical protein
MYHAYNKPYVWSEEHYFFTFPNQQACAAFKHAVAMAGVGRFLPEPVWGDADENRGRYTPGSEVRWGYTIYAFMAHAGAKGMLRGNWIESAVPGGGGRYYLRLYVPGLEESDPYWKRLVSYYK